MTSATITSSGTLWDLLTRGGRGELRAWDGDGYTTLGWPEVVRLAEERAGGLRRSGLEAGQKVPVVLTNSPATVIGLLATWLAGGVPVSLPVPARGMAIERYGEQLRSLCDKLGASTILTDRMLTAGLAEHTAGVGLRAWEELETGSRIEPTPPGDDDPAFVQYSSGSTSDPKGIVLTTRAIREQIDIIRDLLGAQAESDRFASWLPLSHDMGLFGGLVFPWATGMDVLLSTPQRFVQAPQAWLDDCAEAGSTLTVSPNAGIYLAARAHARRKSQVRLALRRWVVGAEPIVWETLTSGAETLAGSGIGMDTFVPAYGLAEATLAVTSRPLDGAPVAVHVDRGKLEQGEVELVAPGSEASTCVVSSGRPCTGVSVRRDPATGLGRIHFSTPSLASGYLDDPEATAARFSGGEFTTDDLGFEHDGELYVVGRSDDVVFVAGRNVYVNEIEAEIGASSTVRTGCCAMVAVDAPMGQRLVAIMELADETLDPRKVASEAGRAAVRIAGATLHECIFLPRGTLPKTPSGKLQRYRAREIARAAGAPPGANRVPLRS